MQALPVHNCVRGVRVAQVVEPRIGHDPGRVPRRGPEIVKFVLAHRSVLALARKHPLPGRRFGEAVQQLPSRHAEQNVPRPRSSRQSGSSGRASLPTIAGSVSRRGCTRLAAASARPRRRPAFRLRAGAGPRRASQGRPRRAAARATVAGSARCPRTGSGGFGPMAPCDGAVEHAAQYVMTSIRPARLPSPVFVEEAGNVGPHQRADAKMADSGQNGAVEVAHGGLDGGRLP